MKSTILVRGVKAMYIFVLGAKIPIKIIEWIQGQVNEFQLLTDHEVKFINNDFYYQLSY